MSPTDLMTAKDIAAILQLSVRHVRERLVHEADFPRPALNRAGCRRWRRSAFEAWIAKQEALSMRGRDPSPRYQQG